MRELSLSELVEYLKGRDKKVFISGAITSRLDSYKLYFDTVADELTDNGIENYNPATIDINTSWEDSMKQTIIALTYCDIVYVLKGWEDSRGAKEEIYIAKMLGIDVIYQK